MSSVKNGKGTAIGFVAAVLVVIVLICVFHSGRQTKSDNNPAKTGNSVSETISETVVTTESTTKYSLVDPSSINTDFSCFDNCAFIGNSRLLALGNYGIAKNVFAKVALNVTTVFTDPGEGRSVPVINELDGKQFDKIFIMFGDNECGWGSMETFRNQYKKVISTCRQKVPGAEIILLSCLPISKTTSDKNVYEYNINNINNVNVIIEEIASEEGCKFIETGVHITGPDGYLPEDYSADGTHLKKDYCLVWARTVADNM